jgi:hypothetical protein
MARQLRQSHHYTGDMRLRVSKQQGETYKCHRGDHHFHSHKGLPSEHPQSTIRMKHQIVSRYLRLRGAQIRTTRGVPESDTFGEERSVKVQKDADRVCTGPSRPIAGKQRSRWLRHSYHQAILPRGEIEGSKRESPVALND